VLSSNIMSAFGARGRGRPRGTAGHSGVVSMRSRLKQLTTRDVKQLRKLLLTKGADDNCNADDGGVIQSSETDGDWVPTHNPNVDQTGQDRTSRKRRMNETPPARSPVSPTLSPQTDTSSNRVAPQKKSKKIDPPLPISSPAQFIDLTMEPPVPHSDNPPTLSQEQQTVAPGSTTVRVSQPQRGEVITRREKRSPHMYRCQPQTG
jgi:hypothetical protein